jgi:hypothetical protein
MKSISKFASVGAVSILGVTVLAGCSSGDDPATDTTTSSESNQMLPPVIVTADQTDASATVGAFIDIVVDDPANTTIAVDNAEVLEVIQGKDDGSATFNPGAEALSPGTATITVTSPDGSIRDIVVTVS